MQAAKPAASYGPDSGLGAACERSAADETSNVTKRPRARESGASPHARPGRLSAKPPVLSGSLAGPLALLLRYVAIWIALSAAVILYNKWVLAFYGEQARRVASMLRRLFEAGWHSQRAAAGAGPLHARYAPPIPCTLNLHPKCTGNLLLVLPPCYARTLATGCCLAVSQQRHACMHACLLACMHPTGL